MNECFDSELFSGVYCNHPLEDGEKGLTTIILSIQLLYNHLLTVLVPLKNDSLSLAMFEAFRGLRDAVAPESGNLGGNVGNNNNGNNNNNNTNNNGEDQADSFDEFFQSYQNGDPETLAAVQKITSTLPRKREDFIRIHAKLEMQKDSELVKKLATTLLDKSADIDERVAALPGMHRTRAEQMEYIQELLTKNQQVAQKLEGAYQQAQERRDSVRKFVRENTCAALGIVEDKD
jgi:hypothetical protein